MEIPKNIKKFEFEINKYALETIVINAKPSKKDEPTKITESKFLGKPYLPLNVEYPKDKTGKPMIMLAQINFAEIPKLELYPDKGIFQLFVASEDWYDMEDYKILFHEELENYQQDFSFLKDELFSDSPIECEHKLSFEKKIEFGSPTDFRFDLNFDGDDLYDFQENLDKKEIKELDDFFDSCGHKIGGYAYFTQSDPRDYDEKNINDLLILQIDTDEKIMFGDSGVANVFINKNDLIEKRFEKAYFNWDCC